MRSFVVDLVTLFRKERFRRGDRVWWNGTSEDSKRYFAEFGEGPFEVARVQPLASGQLLLLRPENSKQLLRTRAEPERPHEFWNDMVTKNRFKRARSHTGLNTFQEAHHG